MKFRTRLSVSYGPEGSMTREELFDVIKSQIIDAFPKVLSKGSAVVFDVDCYFVIRDDK